MFDETVKASVLQCVQFDNSIDESLKLVTREIDYSELNPEDVFIKLLATSINPADILLIKGHYGMTPPKPPLVPGIEGVYEVVKCGSQVSNFNNEDWVLVISPGEGRWQSHMIVHSKDLFKIPKSIGIEAAATIFINPVTAYVMLDDFVTLNKDDSVVISGPTSSVGRALIQICKARGFKSICIVRPKDMTDEIESELLRLGATYVFDENDLLTAGKWSEIPRPKLALECVGGKLVDIISKIMAENSVIVVYGCLSMQTLNISSFDVIFKNIRVCGFWLHKWISFTENRGHLEEILFHLIASVKEGKFETPACEFFPLKDYISAIENASQPRKGKKVLMVP